MHPENPVYELLKSVDTSKIVDAKERANIESLVVESKAQSTTKVPTWKNLLSLHALVKAIPECKVPDSDMYDLSKLGLWNQ